MKIFNALVIGDPHIEDESVEELENIFTEVVSYKAKKLIMLGDYYTKNRPTAKELTFGTKWASIFVDLYDEVIFLKGNHTKSGTVYSCVDYLNYLGITVVEDYEVDNHYFGHYMLNESRLAFDSGEKSKADLEHYNFAVLGHQHCFQEITPKIIHLGAIRKVDFGEASYEPPQLLAFDSGQPIYLPLVSPTAMKIVSNVGQMRDVFKETKGICKIYIIFKSFNQFLKEIEEINKLKDKFIDVKIKLDFVEEKKKIEININQNFKELLYEFVSQQDELIQKELKEEIENVL